jgi:cytosine/adenosine deaminase-related metal-dependent hydrolase
MLINNVHIINEAENLSQIEIKDSRVIAVRPQKLMKSDGLNGTTIDFAGAIAFPGLINSHDHLEFNLFPQLRNKIYTDYVEWGDDIHEKNSEEIENIKKIPYDLRFKWGLYKNLICGITTVAHHGKGQVFRYNNLPDIITGYNYLHSIRLENHWKLKLNSSFTGKPFVIHVGEGIHDESRKEINDLLNWNLFRKKIIAVHGISLDERQSSKFKALVWCPDSNLNLYGKTANIPVLKSHTEILFGTDSTVSANWNFWQQIRSAREINYLNDYELYKSITGSASDVWRLNSKGSISANKTADIVISKKRSNDEWDSFFNTNPEDILLILKNGKIIFLDEELPGSDKLIDKKEFELIFINSVNKFIIKGASELINSIRLYLPQYEFPFEIV